MFKVDLPENCPPNDVLSTKLKDIYRLVEDVEQLTERDFMTHVEKRISYPPHRLCEAHALSFFTNYNGANNLRKKFKKFRNMDIARGNIPANFGVHQTINKHINFWCYKDSDILGSYSRIERT